ncbi:hypothetical protein N496_18685 (plasmid) [Clostridium botulinum A2B3 87]|uniref:hypothetical protein n=1 Tax=Clostridium botulinum TaxID=1491 RepID=UPI0004A5ACA8|nr:hypothetical protein [Clostridium botulinum]KEI94998.1 hypothetical protein N496_18685 [Clostridium botulinum A2B3 87]
MKYYDIMDKEEKGIFTSFTDKSEAEEWLSKQDDRLLESSIRYGMHIVEVERVTISERFDKAFVIANNAIYFNDRSDYLSVLYEICKTIKPNIDECEIGNKYLEE